MVESANLGVKTTQVAQKIKHYCRLVLLCYSHLNHHPHSCFKHRLQIQLLTWKPSFRSRLHDQRCRTRVFPPAGKFETRREEVCRKSGTNNVIFSVKLVAHLSPTCVAYGLILSRGRRNAILMSYCSKVCEYHVTWFYSLINSLVNALFSNTSKKRSTTFVYVLEFTIQYNTIFFI